MSPFEEAKKALDRAHVAALQRGNSEGDEAYDCLRNRQVAYSRALGFEITLNLAMKLAQRQRIEEAKHIEEARCR